MTSSRPPLRTASWLPTAVLAALFVAGAAYRGLGISRPVNTNEWRESDVASMARNFQREGMNILMPRIDWRGDGPGFVESEFPVLPWLTAALDTTLGRDERHGRILSWLFAVGALAVFFRMAGRLLDPAGTIAACVLFAFAPLAGRLATALQPDGLMFFLYVGAAYAFLRWAEEGGVARAALAAALTASAILAKENAAFLGVLVVGLVVTRRGPRELLKPRLWALGALCLLPGALWYAHAFRLWREYGNSLGISNEYHWLGLDVLRSWTFPLDLIRIEFQSVWLPVGVGLGLLAIVVGRRERAVRFAGLWIVALAAYYALTLRTTARDWATYYHVVSIPAAALLAGGGVSAALRRWGRADRGAGLVGVAGAVGVLAVVAAGVGVAAGSGLAVKGGVAALTFAAVLATFSAVRAPGGDSAEAKSKSWLRGVVAGALALAVTAQGLDGLRRGMWYIQGLGPSREYGCASRFARRIPEGSLVLVSGGVCAGPTGRPVAYNAPYFFYWMDRKGWNVCVEEQSLDAVARFRERGARFFVAESSRLEKVPGFREELESRYPVAERCDVATLFDLSGQAGGTP